MFGQMTVFTLGLYLWYFILTLPFAELRLLVGSVKAMPAHGPYFVARYCQLIALITIVVQTHVDESPLNCSSVVSLRIISVCGNVALAASSTNICFRALMIWKHKITYQVIIVCVALVHWVYAIILGISDVKTEHQEHYSCFVILSTTEYELMPFYIFTLVWDFAILMLTIFGPGLRHCVQAREPRPRLVSTLFTQGAIYALVSCIACIPMAILAFLDLNSTMNVLFVMPGHTISVIASSASFTALQMSKLKKSRAANASTDMADTARLTRMRTKDSRGSASRHCNVLTSYLEPDYTADISDADVGRDSESV